MNKREARERIEAELVTHAPNLLPILTVAWADGVTARGAQAFAILHCTWTVPLDATDAALIVFDRRNWRRLSERDREALVLHEVAHLIADAERHATTIPEHGERWQYWYGRLTSEEDEE